MQDRLSAQVRKERGRFVAIGAFDGRCFVLVFIVVGGDVRAISLRPASRKERKQWSER